MSSQSMEKSSSDAQTVKNVDSKEEISTNDAKPGSSSLSYKFKAGLFLSSIAGIGFLAGFGGSLAATKKKDPTSFDEGIVGKRSEAAVYESGAKLASRALARGTLYAFAGCGILFFGVWKLSGAENLADFRRRAGSVLPRVPKNDPPIGRTEFSGINDFLHYIIERDEEEKKLKKKDSN